MVDESTLRVLTYSLGVCDLVTYDIPTIYVKFRFILMVMVSILQTPPAKLGIKFTSPAGCRLSHYHFFAQCTPRHTGDFKYKDQPPICEFETVLGCLMLFSSKSFFLLLLFGLGGDSPPFLVDFLALEILGW